MAEDKVREIDQHLQRERAAEELKKIGMVFPYKVDVPPEFLSKGGYLIIPDDFSDMPIDEIGRYLSIFTALAVYYDVIVASTEIDKDSAERVKDYIEAKKLVELRESKKYGSVTEMKAARNLDETVIKAQDWADGENAMYTFASAILRGCERILFLLSREITRRGNVTTYETRSKNTNPFRRGIDDEN